MKVLVTGVAGFIGSRVAELLLERGEDVLGVDSLDDYYDIGLKRARLARLSNFPNWQFIELPVEVMGVGSEFLDGVDRIVHLAAQAGVRYSLKQPDRYLRSNLDAFGKILEVARNLESSHLVYASSSSVYGANRDLPFRPSDPVNHPVSLYAATKRANELMAESYSHLFEIPMTGLRFFTAYGPWGRPDMAIFDFTRRILNGQEIQLFGDGQLSRDFTYIDDIARGVIACLDKPPNPRTYAGPSQNMGSSPHMVLNLGSGVSSPVQNMLEELELVIGREAKVRLVARQAGDVDHTFADIAPTREWCSYHPSTPLREGLRLFWDWYQSYYGASPG